MQAESAPFSSSSQHGHPAADHELKRKYLALLPPQQIIELCLNFELHVPHYVKHSIWPVDLNAAIAALQSQSKGQGPDQPVPSTETPIMDSLSDSSHQPSSSERAQHTEPLKPPDSTGDTPAPTMSGSSTSLESPPSTSVTLHVPQVQPTQPAPTPYPHQPYGYPPTSTYPHAPYYTPHLPNYPYLPSASYAYPHPLGYPPHPTPGYPPHPHAAPHPSFPNAPLVPFAPVTAEQPNSNGTDDLPSYEEMIVEALQDCNDPEGCAPKNLFSWMASHYPLQSNFRPSASQALQKAFKRGRLEKSSNGKYRLNAAWEGGNTSRRTTRRPQTHNLGHVSSQAPLNNSPFTHAPLMNRQTGQPLYPYPYFAPGYPAPPSEPTTKPGDAGSTAAQSREVAEAWEAAHNILKSINFGGLLQMPEDRSKAGTNQDSTPAATTIIGTTIPGSVVVGTRSSAANVSLDSPDSIRASLQGSLALLAAQLEEIAQTSHELIIVSGDALTDKTSTEVEVPESSDNDDDDDMDEVIV